jgi:hypothetical protein
MSELQAIKDQVLALEPGGVMRVPYSQWVKACETIQSPEVWLMEEDGVNLLPITVFWESEHDGFTFANTQDPA